jgi:hypothetical protein
VNTVEPFSTATTTRKSAEFEIGIRDSQHSFRPIQTPVTSQGSSQYKSSSTNPSPQRYLFKGNSTQRLTDYLTSSEAQTHEQTKLITELNNIRSVAKSINTHQVKINKRLTKIYQLSISTFVITTISWIAYVAVSAAFKLETFIREIKASEE